MALKKKTTPVNGVQEERETHIKRLVQELENLHVEAKKIEQRKTEVHDQITTLQLHPFKPGDIVLCEVPAGRRKEVKKCIIEVEDGDVYVRPYKNGTDELSGRHFFVMPLDGGYASVFKRCD